MPPQTRSSSPGRPTVPASSPVPASSRTWTKPAAPPLTYDRATPHLDEAFACARAATHGFGTQTIPRWIAQSRERFAGHEIWLTEWNVKPVLPFVNTWMHGAFAFETWLALFETEGLTLAATHNGISPDIFGLLSNARDLDATTRTLVPRVALHAMVLAAEARRGERLGGESVGLVRATTLEEEHGRVFFVNDGATAVMLAVPNGQRPLGLRVVSGRALYASAGHAGPLADASGYRRSPPGIEIEGIEARPFDGTVPPFSFGILDTTSAP